MISLALLSWNGTDCGEWGGGSTTEFNVSLQAQKQTTGIANKHPSRLFLTAQLGVRSEATSANEPLLAFLSPTMQTPALLCHSSCNAQMHGRVQNLSPRWTPTKIWPQPSNETRRCRKPSAGGSSGLFTRCLRPFIFYCVSSERLRVAEITGHICEDDRFRPGGG